MLQLVNTFGDYEDSSFEDNSTYLASILDDKAIALEEELMEFNDYNDYGSDSGVAESEFEELFEGIEI